jgi:hypothetical protein
MVSTPAFQRGANSSQLSQWRTQLGLGPAIGATYYTINTSPNAQSVAPAVHGNGLATLAFGALSLACLSLVL